MLTKEQLDTLVQPLVDVYNGLENDMLVTMADKLKNKSELLATDPQTWKLLQLQQLGMLDHENIAAVKKTAGLMNHEINKLLYDAGIDGLANTEKALQAALKKGAKLAVPKPVTESPVILQILQAYQKQAKDIFNLANMTLVDSAKKAHIEIINRAVADVVSGFKTHDEALRSAVRGWAENGLPALIDKGGRKWGVEGYVRTVMITTAKNTMHALQDARCEEYGIKYVEVSSHAGARPLCAPYQGKIYRLGEDGDQKYPNIFTDTSYGQAAGLFGINCGHRKYPFIPGFNTQRYFPYPKEENDKIYKESQMQRAHERSIRKAKTQYEMFKKMGDQKGMEQAKALIKQRQAKIRDFIDKTGRTRRPYREQIHTNKGPEKALDKLQKPTPYKKKEKPLEQQQAQQQQIQKDLQQLDYTVGKHIQYKDQNGNLFSGEIVYIYDNEDAKIKSHMNGQNYFVSKKNVVSNIANPVKQPVTPPPMPKPAKPKAATKGNTFDTSTFENVNIHSTPDLGRDANILKNMTKKDRDIVVKYTSNYYWEMNTYLRNVNNPAKLSSSLSKADIDKLKDEVVHLTNVLKANAKPLSQDTMFYRQIDNNAMRGLFGDEIHSQMANALRGDITAQETVRKMLVGGALHDPAYMSSAYVKGAFGDGKDILVQIHAKKGYNGGMFVESVSHYRNEKEYLHNSGVTFDILGIEFKNGKAILNVLAT